MARKSITAVNSPGPRSNLHIGPNFAGKVHVDGSWNHVIVEGGNVEIGASPADVTRSLGMSFSEPYAVAHRAEGLLVLFGTGCSSHSGVLKTFRSGRPKARR